MAVENIANSAKITFIISGEFAEFCLDNSLDTIRKDLKSYIDENKVSSKFKNEVIGLDKYEFYDRKYFSSSMKMVVA